MAWRAEVFEFVWLMTWLGAVVTIPSVILQRRTRPTAALSWLLALFALPPVALFAWWLFGRTHLKRKRLRRQRASRIIEKSLSATQQHLYSMLSSAAEAPSSTPRLPSWRAEQVFPAAGGNVVRLYPSATEFHQAWREAIAGAEHHLHCLFYIWRDDATGRAFRDLLAEKAATGVEIRVLYDAVGSLGLPRRFFDPLKEQGGRVAPFMPIRLLVAAPTLNFRNHRKILIADGCRACTGGINVGDEYLLWEDVGITLEGLAVNQVQEVFVDDWYFATGEELTDERYFTSRVPIYGVGGAHCETVASGPDQTLNAMRDMVALAVTQCRLRLWIATPYFIPDGSLLLALRTAAYRGVDVRVFLPAESDTAIVRRASRVFYPELLEGGVRVYEYQGMLHAKAVLLDQTSVLIGSANLDLRSFRLNFEIGTFVTSPALNRDLAAWFERVEAGSRQVVREDTEKESPTQRLTDALVHLLSPLL